MKSTEKKADNLRRGWTTGACATAAAKTACLGLLTGEFPDPVTITLPGGQTPAFALAQTHLGEGGATASIVKDAGDDPDVTHGALISVKVSRSAKGSGLHFLAGPGVGTATLPGLPIAPGEPAINPAPRKMIAAALKEVTSALDFNIEISIKDGEKLALKTLNPRLGIKGGLSILGTTGIVIPFSCAAWIDSIHRGVDVARALGHNHIAASTGDTSEKAVRAFHGLDDQQLIEMGDFIGGTLKYVRNHPVKRLTLAGGVAKMTKLAQGMLDVHSKRGRADMDGLAQVANEAGASSDLCEQIRKSNTVAEAFTHAAHADIPLGDIIAASAWATAAKLLEKCDAQLEILIFDRDGVLQGQAPFRSTLV